MHQPHPAFTPPSNENVPLWRYIDFAKFVDMLERSALHFARLDRLGDVFEGAVSSADIALNREHFQHIETLDGETHDQYFARMFRTIYAVIQKTNFVNCWHMNEHESQAMWRLYSQEGIAIRSTYQRLIESFSGVTDREIYIGQVNYRNYDTDHVLLGSQSFSAVVSKRKSFEHERELRAVINIAPTKVVNGESIIDLSIPDHPNGVSVPVDVRTLIERVYVAPGRPRWFKELVRSILDRYELEDLLVEGSVLDRRLDLV